MKVVVIYWCFTVINFIKFPRFRLLIYLALHALVMQMSQPLRPPICRK